MSTIFAKDLRSNTVLNPNVFISQNKSFYPLEIVYISLEITSLTLKIRFLKIVFVTHKTKDKFD